MNIVLGPELASAVEFELAACQSLPGAHITLPPTVPHINPRLLAPNPRAQGLSPRLNLIHAHSSPCLVPL